MIVFWIFLAVVFVELLVFAIKVLRLLTADDPLDATPEP